MEIIDILNEDGVPTGETTTRETIHRMGLWHRTVHIWIINENDEILLQKRAPEKETNPGMWDIACAGHITAGDSSVRTALKELEEELGIVAEKSDIKFLFTQKESSVHHQGSYIDNELHDTYLMRTNVPVTAMKFQKSEVSEAAFFSPENLFSLIESKDPALVAHPESYKRIVTILKDLFNMQ